MITADNPLDKLEWNEAEAAPQFYRGLIMIMVFDDNKVPYPIGTGFIFKSTRRKAWAITAAHVLDEISSFYKAPPRHNRTALSVFLPRPKPFQLDKRKIRAFLNIEGRPELLWVTGTVFDKETDIGILTVEPQGDTSPDIPGDELLIDDRVPPVGSLVSMLSFGDLGVQDVEARGSWAQFTLSMRTVVRTGRVIAHHPKGHRLCKGPCLETSIPVYSGMSGGPVFAYDATGVFRPVAVVCSDPDPDGDAKLDRTRAGASIMGLLPAKVVRLPNQAQLVKLELNGVEFAGTIVPANVKQSYRPAGPRLLAEYDWRSPTWNTK